MYLIAINVLGLVAMSLLGCSSTSSKDAYIDKADAICIESTEKQMDLLKEPESAEPDEEFETEDLQRLIDLEVKDLRALKRPGEDRTTLDQVLKLKDETAKLSGKILEAGDTEAGLQLSRKGVNIAEKMDKAAKKYGFEFCGRILEQS